MFFSCNFSRPVVLFLTAISFISTLESSAQVVANPDSYTFQVGDVIIANVLDNDIVPPAGIIVVQTEFNPCFSIIEDGSIQWNTENQEDCCGDHTLFYYLTEQGVGQPLTPTVSVMIRVDCAKPDCNLIDLSSYLTASDNPIPGESCVSVCEESDVTFYVPLNTNETYQWSVTGDANGVTGTNAAEYIVSWGAPGTGVLQLIVTDASNTSTTITICIDVLPKPIASFSSSGYVCLDQCLQFTNTSLNASSYQWDFGDGNTSIDENPCHTFTNPGLYTVTLTATNQNFGDDGRVLCCCTDEFTMEVEVDELPGPSIFWVSTLCEGDESCYWTDAINCSNYTWTIFDSNGTDITNTASGQGTDTICVTWTSGPAGTVELSVSGCDSTYCDNPSSVQVPIISSVGTIEGPIVVCANSTEVYSLPKWLSTTYDWNVTGGTLVGLGTGHVGSINWGSPGTGTIVVNYGSEFLDCLPEHEEGDCQGSATLDVVILPSFDVTNNGPAQVCIGSSSVLSATSTPSSIYTWTVAPSLPANTTTGQGSDAFTINWGAAGTYIISAEPSTSGIYCNEKETVVITVVDVPIPVGIDGPIEICAGEEYFYTALPGGSGFGYTWTALNGSLSSSTGATVGVIWNPTGPYSLSVSHIQNAPPFCQSPPFAISVNPKGPNGPYTITGGPSCLNSLTSYTLTPNILIPPPHPEIAITWSLTDPTLGSIVSGQGTNAVQVQWGNTTGSVQLIASAELCGIVEQTIFNIILSPAPNPVITQAGLLCPSGNSVSLTVNPTFASYSWTPGSGTTQTISTSTPGTATVTVTDVNGCQNTAFHQVETQPGPVAEIYSEDGNIICIQSPSSITLVAQTNPNYTFTWYCLPPLATVPVLVQGPSSSPTFTHVPQGAGTYTYYFEVTESTNPSCSNQSDNFNITEVICEGSGPGCDPEAFTLSGVFSPATPDCDKGSFSYTASPNFTFTGWTFGDGNGSALPSPTHTYSTVGCYTARVCGTVPKISNPLETCTVCSEVELCVPVKARISVNNPSCGVFDFSNQSTFLPGNGPLSYFWSANDLSAQTSTLPNPSFTFPPQGPVTVTLIATTPAGCESEVSIIVIPNSLGTPVIIAPASICMNDAFNFSVTAPTAVSADWIFGTSGTYGEIAGQFAYTSPPTVPGSNTISVTVSDAIGCTVTVNTSITVYPEVPPAQISAVPDLVICQGSNTTLSGPSGYSYLWSPGAQTSQSIVVGAGTYELTLTDFNGCTRELDEVEVIEVPLPLAPISGDLIICDQGCTTLSTPLDPSNTYQWLDDQLSPIPFATFSQYTICDSNILPAYSVEVTDQNGCIATGGPVVVSVATSPSFSVSAAPSPLCAGQPTTLSIVPFDPLLNYSWSTGETSQNITVTQAGTYTVVGTDNATGCSHTFSATVNPLPDLCLVPEGCYDMCPPKTICGPSGLVSYQWNLDGSPIFGATDTCLTISSSGIYSLTATNQFGCTDTSGQLVANILDCPSTACDSLDVDYSFLTTPEGSADSCCVSLSYNNQYGDIKGITISTDDGDILTLSGTLSSLLNFQSNTMSSVVLTSATAGNPIPSGILSDFLELCIDNPVSAPQIIFFEWVDFNNEVVCQDSILLNCPVEPDCLYLLNDSIFCEDKNVSYSFTVCNPLSSAYPIGFIDILPSGPSGIVLSPPSIDISTNPILPGNCQTFVIQLSGAGIEGETFCYSLVGHEYDPTEDPGALCCSIDTLYCVDIPYCDPCPFVNVAEVFPGEEDCCFNAVLTNDFTPGYFDQIDVCIITPQTTFNVNNPLGSGWLTSGLTSTSLSFIPEPISLGVPGGLLNLPEICLQAGDSPYQQIEIKWMKDGMAECRDTIEVFCEPPCGYLTDESILCEGNTGFYIYQGILNNNSGQTLTEAHVEFTSPAGMSLFDQTINFPPLSDGLSTPISFSIGLPALPGDTVCFTITLHQLNSDGTTVQCCEFEHCIVLPSCSAQDHCECDEEFTEMMTGINFLPITTNAFTFNPSGGPFDDECDSFTWSWGDGSPQGLTTGPVSIMHTFPFTAGVYKVCMLLTRVSSTGGTCKKKACIKMVIPNIFVSPNASISIFPNPGTGVFEMLLSEDVEYPIRVIVRDLGGKEMLLLDINAKPDLNKIQIDLTKYPNGMFFIQLQEGGEQIVRKVIKI